MLGGGDKSVKLKWLDGHPQGCLVGKYKPLGKKIKFLAWKKNLELSVFTTTFLHKIPKYVNPTNHEPLVGFQFFVLEILQHF